MKLKLLPPRELPYSPQVYHAASLLEHIYSPASTSLSAGSLDAHQSIFHKNAIHQEAIPLLLDLESCTDEEGLSLDWIKAVSQQFGKLLRQLAEAEEAAFGREKTGVFHTEPVFLAKTGKRGRPRKLIAPRLLQEATNGARRVTLTKLASCLGIHRQTLRTHLKENSIDYRFCPITNADLDKLTKRFKETNPASGLGYVMGFLRQKGYRLQRQRVKDSLKRVDRLGSRLRRRLTISRGLYKVPRPHALWHLDGHHKLIFWGIVIHGIVDGYSRTVVGLQASSNNKASTVLNLFTEAAKEYGVPSRVRLDRGGENIEVATLMVFLRGPNRASAMWGSSTHNTKIE
ncbi:hypothetical protein HHX47_DHR1001651 [Lentinula edodes]|nr:hypothetical protein HHX47_DHR1001651 [Lentinula edodes]